ncbi:hypothetical protein D187_003637 [Cystobacter fuscus DSM 2262]|uniref:Uncharacterized protein n=1 Tax=Cystobacter fuscus (strain ATCC 25194 / DSM 2262 / NBRC 100088 / M29) TaxID=1242864 RepID=S9P9G8_CYSF2|nr:hypothetical protein [Cystobacter fuscus]EPX58922.1 hypothetical protein D187_003637 [Cystobacter fuscus DSM 2262]
MSIADSAATELHLPVLNHARENLVIARMPRLQRLELPVLYHVGEKFIVRDTEVLVSFSLPNLQELPGEFDLWNNAGLTTFDVPKLWRVGGWVYISDNEALTTLSGLRNVTSVGISFCSTEMPDSPRRRAWPHSRAWRPTSRSCTAASRTSACLPCEVHGSSSSGDRARGTSN